MKLTMVALCWFAALILPCHIEAQDQNTQRSQESARSFVREFYEWYMQKVVQPNAGRGSDLALKFKPKVFSSELFRALKEDSDAQARAKGEIAGLDFDPFLNSQDPCDRYEVGGIQLKGQHYQVEVFGVCQGKKPRSQMS